MLTFNANYIKYKRILDVSSTTSASQLLHVGINYNGLEGVPNTTTPSTALWFNRGTGAAAQSVTITNANGPSAAFYDQNRIAGISVKWYPALPNGAVLASYHPLAITYDRDGIEDNVLTQTVANALEQVNQVKVKNMYRPWKVWRKAPKQRLRTKIPSAGPPTSTTSPGSAYSPNQNLAGQWKRVSSALWPNATFETSFMNDPVTRGTHLLFTFESPDLEAEAYPNGALLGRLQITSYFVYKDRQ